MHRDFPCLTFCSRALFILLSFCSSFLSFSLFLSALSSHLKLISFLKKVKGINLCLSLLALWLQEGWLFSNEVKNIRRNSFFLLEFLKKREKETRKHFLSKFSFILLLRPFLHFQVAKSCVSSSYFSEFTLSPFLVALLFLVL